ncbi:MAG TPA: YiiX/YebB-like N1pC/P60 family cysteine hydrolase [Xanthobacteraceae bacterium]|nr:YiiX/YebB-like N1pC/P60 family cysteine hydrolase [Xanthobacteraceae bacterium]
MIFGKILDFFGQRLADYLTRPIPGFRPASTTEFDKLRRAMHTGDVLLVEGDTRVATAIKYLTQSTWSHSALYVGPIAGRSEPDGEPHVLVEALVEEGVISVPLSKYKDFHTRICRPIGLSEDDRRTVANFTVERIGYQYDVKNIVDLARYLLPTPPVPSRFRRRLIALGSGEPTRAICSTLIALAFQSVRYPILPRVDHVHDPDSPVQDPEAQKEILRIRHHSLFAPRDFDISPYFSIVKPTIEAGFDYHQVTWARPEDEAA